MAELKYDKDGRLLFTKEMKEEYTILMPQMLPVHFGMFQQLLILEGYKVDMLTTNHRGSAAPEGTIGLLEVLPQYRRRGLATLLQSHMIGLELSRNRVPYGQVFHGNDASLALQRSLGMTRSMGPLYWALRGG